MQQAPANSRYRSLTPGRAIRCSADMFHRITTTPGDHAAADCPACGDAESAEKFATVYAVYFFCSTCGHAWSVEQPLTCEHHPERRRARGPGGD
jgi:hypothetical protein